MKTTRRTLLAAGLLALSRPTTLVSAASSPAGPSPQPKANARHVAPVAVGNKSGIGWANAASIWDLNNMIAAAGPGGTVYIRADAGSYFVGPGRVAIKTGGMAGSSVTIMGVDQSLAPMKASLFGNRTAWTLPEDPEAVTNVKNWMTGGDVFVLRPGADYLTFRNLDFQRTGQPFHLTAPMHRGITVSDCIGYNFRRFFEHGPDTSHVDTILRNIIGTGFSKTAIRIRGDSRNVLLEDIALNSGRQDGDNFATGIECNDTAHDIVMRRTNVANCHDTHNSEPGRFWNADGFASERDNYNIRREDCMSSGNTDAGYDDKGANVTNVNCSSIGNCVNFKLWGSTTNIKCSALNPKRRGGSGEQIQYYAYGGESPTDPGANILIRGGVIADDDRETKIFVAEAYNSVFRIDSVSIARHPDAILQIQKKGRGNSFLFAPAPALQR